MAGVKISALPAIPSCQLTDLIPEVQPAVGGVTYKATLSQLATLFNSSLSFVPLAGGTMSGALILNTNNPTTALQAASKGYVDAVAQGLNILPAAYAATTANLTATYANGTAGVGATLTNSGAMVAFAVDGVSPPINSRILVKNQTTTFQNGVYTLTTVGSGAVNWVLTRATDYDEPSEINPGDFILVNNGTTNSGSGWIETAAVANVGTDPILFSRFGNQNSINNINVQTFVANGTYTPSAGMIYCTVQIVGGGGASGSAAGAAGQVGSSAGGGGGGYCQRTYTSALIGSSAAVVIGGGGTPGAAGNNPGGAGVASTFTCTGAGTTLTANGGGGGGGAASTAGFGQSAGGGAGGTGVGGQINITGGRGTTGLNIDGPSGANITGIGGGSMFGPTQANSGTTGGVAATNYGCGAAGIKNVSGANAAGQAGSGGICVVTEYISTSA